MYKINLLLSPNKLKLELEKLHESDIADIFEKNEFFREKIYLVMGVKAFTKVFVELKDNVKKEFFQTLNNEQKKSLLRFSDTEDIKDFITLYDVKEQLPIISLLNETTKSDLNELLSYEVGSAGSISSPHFITLDVETSVKDATLFVTSKTTEKDEIDVIFFQNELGQFIGAMTLQELISARANQQLINLYDEKYPFVMADDPYELAIKKIRDYDISILPVLDKQKEIMGIILAEDALTIMEEIHIETIQDLVKIHDVQTEDSPLKRSMVRLPWLVVCAILNVIIASFLVIFKPVLEANVAIILFQPMILAMAGNIGTQSIAVTIIKMQSDEKISKKHLFKELGIGLINGLLSSVFGVLIVFLFLFIMPNAYQDIDKLALTVGLSLFVSMFISSLAGVLVPIILKKLKMDEKAASGPLISTINDFTALGIYFLLATIILTSI